MKYLIFSDIHGSIDSVEFLLNKFKELNCDSMICLGDVLYHGPRNDLPKAYAPKEVIKALNPYSDKILCIKGNCEAEVDQMVLSFKIHDFFDGKLNDINVHFEHGHHLDEYDAKCDLVMFGHTHIPCCEKRGSTQFINPGSITIPKNGSLRGYAVWDNHTITCYGMDEIVVSEYNY